MVSLWIYLWNRQNHSIILTEKHAGDELEDIASRHSVCTWVKRDCRTFRNSNWPSGIVGMSRGGPAKLVQVTFPMRVVIVAEPTDIPSIEDLVPIKVGEKYVAGNCTVVDSSLLLSREKTPFPCRLPLSLWNWSDEQGPHSHQTSQGWRWPVRDFSSGSDLHSDSPSRWWILESRFLVLIG